MLSLQVSAQVGHLVTTGASKASATTTIGCSAVVAISGAIAATSIRITMAAGRKPVAPTKFRHILEHLNTIEKGEGDKSKA